MLKHSSDSEREKPLYSFWLVAWDLLYAPLHRQDNTYHSLCHTSCGAQAGTRNTSVGPLWEIDPTIYRTLSESSKRSYNSLPEVSNLEL